MRRSLIVSATLVLLVGGGMGDASIARAQSDTPELDRCLKRPTLKKVLAKTPLPKSVTTFITATWDWIGLSRRARNRSAGEHFVRGDTLYNQGDYEGAVVEFVAAYCDKAHFNPLYNIAQSFERMANYERAVAYLRRVIKEAPKNLSAMREKLAFRVEVLRKLPAQVKVATMPPGANVTLTGVHGVAARTEANKDKPLKVKSGRYKMLVRLPGYEPVTQWVDVQIGQPYSYYFSLKPQTGTVEVITDPPNGRIFIDGRVVAIGKHVQRMPIGKYQLTVEAKDYETKAGLPFEVRDDRTTKMTVKLEEKARSGRVELIIAASLGGASLGGGAFTTIFGEDTAAASLGSALGLGIGIVGGYFGVPKDVQVGTSSYMIATTLIGAAEAALIARWINCTSTQDQTGSFNEDCDAKVISGAAVAGSVAGLLFGAITAGTFDMSAGDAAVLNSSAIWGTVAGALFLAGFDSDPRIADPLILSGLNLGIIGGTLLARRTSISRGHAALIDLSGLAGMVAGVAVVDVLEPDTPGDRLAHFALGGMSIGLIAGAYLTRDMDEPKTLPLRTLKPRLSTAWDSSGRATTTLGMGGSF